MLLCGRRVLVLCFCLFLGSPTLALGVHARRQTEAEVESAFAERKPETGEIVFCRTRPLDYAI